MKYDDEKRTDGKFYLKRIEKYRELNKDFSLFNYIKFELDTSKICSDIYFAFSELFWPSFIMYNGQVFLKERFSKKKFESMEKNGGNREFWINFLTINPYFEEDESGDEKARALSKLLVEIWKNKLKFNFPDMDFMVIYLEDEEVGDIGLTFYQTKYKDC